MNTRCNVHPPQTNPVLHTPTTPSEFGMWMHTYEPGADVPTSQIKPSATESSYIMFVSHVNECICNQITCTQPLLIKPSSTKAYPIIAVSHVEEGRCTQVRCTPHITPSGTEHPTTSCPIWPCGRMQTYAGHIYHPLNQPEWYRALLHHINLTCGRMHMCPGQMYTPCWLNPVLLTCTTLYQFDMHKNADTPSSDVTPHSGNWTQSYRALLHHVTLTCGRMHIYSRADVHPPLIQPSATELYYTMSVWHVQTCRGTQVRCTLPS